MMTNSQKDWMNLAYSCFIFLGFLVFLFSWYRTEQNYKMNAANIEENRLVIEENTARIAAELKIYRESLKMTAESLIKDQIEIAKELKLHDHKLRATADVLSKDQIDVRRSLSESAIRQAVMIKTQEELQKNQETASIAEKTIIANQKSLGKAILDGQDDIMRAVHKMNRKQPAGQVLYLEGDKWLTKQ